MIIGRELKATSHAPVDQESVGQELVVEEPVRGEDGDDGDAEVHALAPEEPEGVPVELVVHVLLELPQHAAHLLVGVVHHAARRSWRCKWKRFVIKCSPGALLATQSHMRVFFHTCT